MLCKLFIFLMVGKSQQFRHNLAKNKVILPKKAVTKVYDMPVNYFNNVKIGDKMEVIE